MTSLFLLKNKNSQPDVEGAIGAIAPSLSIVRARPFPLVEYCLFKYRSKEKTF